MTPAIALSFLTTYGPWIVTGASTLAALIPASAVNSNPALKTLTAMIDVLALNFGFAKQGPTPAGIAGELITGKPSEQREAPGNVAPGK